MKQMNERTNQATNKRTRVSCVWVLSLCMMWERVRPCRCRCEVRCAEEVKNIYAIKRIKSDGTKNSVRSHHNLCVTLFFANSLLFHKSSILLRFVQFSVEVLVICCSCYFTIAVCVLCMVFLFGSSIKSVYVRALQFNSWIAVLIFAASFIYAVGF